MLLRELEYVRPDSLDEAIALLSDLPDAGILAGGQSLVNVLKMRIGGYSTLIDISRLEELKSLERREDTLYIGAGVTYDTLIHSMDASLGRPILGEVAVRIADQQVQSRGTVAGNCCYNDPTCHFPPILSAVGAQFEILSKSGRRTLSSEDFFVSYYQTALEPGEMLVGIMVPTLAGSQGDGFSPLSVGGTDVLNIITGAATVSLDADGRIGDVRIVVTGASERPLLLTAVQDALTGTPGSTADLDTAFARVDPAEFDPPDDVHASSDYRRAMAPVFARRAVEQALDNARRGSND